MSNNNCSCGNRVDLFPLEHVDIDHRNLYALIVRLFTYTRRLEKRLSELDGTPVEGNELDKLPNIRILGNRVPDLCPEHGQGFFNSRRSVPDAVCVLWDHVQNISKLINDGLNAIVAAGTAFCPDAKPSGGQGDVIKHNDDPLRGNTEITA